MSALKFKVGDRVICVACNGGFYKVGAIGVIVEVDEKDDIASYQVQFSHGNYESPGLWWCMEDHLALCEDQPKGMPKYHVMDNGLWVGPDDSVMHEALLPEDDGERQKARLADYFVKYFPHAQVAKSVHSYESNVKHNGGEGMEWAHTKSVGDGNQIMRHLIEGLHCYRAGNMGEARYHLTCLAWRGDELLERFLTRMPPFDGKANQEDPT